MKKGFYARKMVFGAMILMAATFLMLGLYGEAVAASDRLQASSNILNGTFRTPYPDWETIRSTGITADGPGWLFISANGSTCNYNNTDEYTATFAIGFDDWWDMQPVTGYITAYRKIDIINDSGDGSDKPLSITLLRSVQAGSYSVDFLVNKNGGTGQICMHDPNISVIFIPSSSKFKACGSASLDKIPIVSDEGVLIDSCSLTLSEIGSTYIAANGYVDAGNYLYPNDYSAMFSVDNSDTLHSSSPRRYLFSENVGLGQDTFSNLSLTTKLPGNPGSNTYYHRGWADRTNYNGYGIASIKDRSLSAIFIPDSDLYSWFSSRKDYDSPSKSWKTTSPNMQPIYSMNYTMPSDGWVYISADATAVQLDGAYEAEFRIGIDNPAGDSDTRRWVNIYDRENDTGAVSLSVLKFIKAGLHTFYFVGKKKSDLGPGTVTLRYPTMSTLLYWYPKDPVIAPADCTGSLGNQVWKDVNGNGIYDAAIDKPLADVNIWSVSGSVLKAAKTDQNGRYSFNDLCPGDYTIYAGLPTGHTPVAQLGSINIDNDNDGQAGSILGLPASVTASFPLGEGQSKQTIDFGFRDLSCTASIGNQVWIDSNGNGTYEQGTDTPFPFVLLAVLDGKDNIYNFFLSDGDGHYSFWNLCAGDYKVAAFSPAGYSPVRALGSVNTDNDNDGQDVYFFGHFSVTPVFPLGQSESKQSVDFGFTTSKFIFMPLIIR
jgi:hypothetical protein